MLLERSRAPESGDNALFPHCFVLYTKYAPSVQHKEMHRWMETSPLTNVMWNELIFFFHRHTEHERQKQDCIRHGDKCMGKLACQRFCEIFFVLHCFDTVFFRLRSVIRPRTYAQAPPLMVWRDRS